MTDYPNETEEQYSIALEQERQLEESKLDSAFERIREIFKDRGENLDNKDEESLLSADEKPIIPDFPFIIVMLAILKDVAIDGPLTFSIIFGIFTPIVSFALAVILFFWVLGKLSGGWWKKKLIRWIWMRYIAAIAIELIPWINAIPATTIFILMAHYRNKKLVQLFDLALEELKGTGVLKHIK